MKEKLYDSINGLKNINLLLIIFLAFGVKSIVVGTDLASAAVLAIFGAVYLGGRLLKLREPDKKSNRVKSELDKINGEIKELKGALAKTNVGKLTKKERYF